MDKFLHSDLPWQFKMLALLAAGLVLAVLTLAIPERVYVFVGRKFPWWSPSVTSGGRVIIYWVSLIAGYLIFSVFWGFLGVVEGSLLDVVDGRQAMIYARHNISRVAWEERLGKVIDPTCDKITVPPTLVYFGYLGAANLWLTIAIMAVDVAGTIVRHAKDIGNLLARIGKRNGRIGKVGEWLTETHKNMTRHESATSVGKVKALMQNLTLISCVPCQQGWISDTRFTNAMCIFTLALGVFSIASRLYVHPSLDSCVDWITSKFFRHVDFRQMLRDAVTALKANRDMIA